jgi:putative FmdB family regulatory protein
MPIYEYRRADGSTFEVIQKFTDDPLTTDPDTGKPVERVYSAPAIHFKGSGFHNTDYGSNRRAKAGSGGSSDSSDSGSSGSNESKPAKSDSKADAAGKSSKPEKAPKKD